MEAYITKNQAIHAMEQVTQPECFIEDTRKNFARIIEELPAADVVEVVRCNDCVKNEKCMLYSDYRYPFFDEDFCSYGWDGED